MNVAMNPSLEEKRLKLELRLAQLEKNERCQNNFLTFVLVDKKETLKSFLLLKIILKVFSPIDPVEPRMPIFIFI